MAATRPSRAVAGLTHAGIREFAQGHQQAGTPSACCQPQAIFGASDEGPATSNVFQGMGLQLESGIVHRPGFGLPVQPLVDFGHFLGQGPELIWPAFGPLTGRLIFLAFLPVVSVQ